jgi:hypothetical protein
MASFNLPSLSFNVEPRRANNQVLHSSRRILSSPCGSFDSFAQISGPGSMGKPFLLKISFWEWNFYGHNWFLDASITFFAYGKLSPFLPFLRGSCLPEEDCSLLWLLSWMEVSDLMAPFAVLLTLKSILAGRAKICHQRQKGLSLQNKASRQQGERQPIFT